MQDLPTIIQYPIDFGGFRSRALEAGQGENVVVCFHGAGSRADRWRPAMARLANKGYHCYAIDYPGHGLAAKPRDYPYSVETFAEYALEFIDSLAHESLVIAGTSIGAHVGGLVTLERRERVQALCLIGGVGLVERELRRSVGGGDISATGRAGIRAKLEFLVYDPALVTEDWVTEEWRINSSDGATEALAALQDSLAQPPKELIAGRLAELEIPTMLCWGLDDRWVPVRDGYAAHEVIAASPLVLMREASHAPYFERPGAFVETLDRFLRNPQDFGNEVVTI